MKQTLKHICKCLWCINTRKLGLEFDHYEPKTNLQKRMKSIIKTIEKRNLNRN
jgi:hypothetical protein